MDESVFRLTDAISGAPLVALVAALVWGVLSVLLSPCHLGTIPLVVGYVGAGTATARGRGTALAFAFAGGMLAAIAVVGALAVAIGHALSGFGSASNYIIGLVFLAAGLNLLGWLPLPSKGVSVRAGKGKGLLAAAGIGRCSALVCHRAPLRSWHPS